MGWSVDFEPRAFAELQLLDRITQKRILKFLQQRIAGSANTRESGKPLTGEKAGFWRYRVGNYRIVCQLDDQKQAVLVARIAHRKDVYR